MLHLHDSFRLFVILAFFPPLQLDNLNMFAVLWKDLICFTQTCMLLLCGKQSRLTKLLLSVNNRENSSNADFALLIFYFHVANILEFKVLVNQLLYVLTINFCMFGDGVEQLN